jgi:hypothetical protein
VVEGDLRTVDAAARPVVHVDEDANDNEPAIVAGYFAPLTEEQEDEAARALAAFLLRQGDP